MNFLVLGGGRGLMSKAFYYWEHFLGGRRVCGSGWSRKSTSTHAHMLYTTFAFKRYPDRPSFFFIGGGFLTWRGFRSFFSGIRWDFGLGKRSGGRLGFNVYHFFSWIIPYLLHKHNSLLCPLCNDCIFLTLHETPVLLKGGWGWWDVSRESREGEGVDYGGVFWVGKDSFRIHFLDWVFVLRRANVVCA